MVCPNCGRQIINGNQCPCINEGQHSPNPAINLLKTEGTSGKFLIGLIALTVARILYFFTSGGLYISTFYSIIEMMEDLGYYDAASNMANAFYSYASNASVFIATVLALLPELVILVGLWCIFISCKNKMNPGVSKAGFMIIKVVQVISITIFIVAMAIVLIIAVMAGVSSGDAAAGVGMFILLIPIAIVVLVAVLYYRGVIKTLNGAMEVSKTGRPSLNTSSFVMVLLFISGIVSILSMFSNIVDYFNYGRYVGNTNTLIAGFSSGLIGLSNLLFGITMNSYRAGMMRLAYNAPVYNTNIFQNQGVNGANGQQFTYQNQQQPYQQHQ